MSETNEHVTINVDGEDVVLMGGTKPTEYVLELAGLTRPDRYDLVRLDAEGKHLATLHPGSVVVLEDGDEFISVAIAATT